MTKCEHEDVMLDEDENGVWVIICENCYRMAKLVQPVKWYQTKKSKEWDA